MRIASIAHQLNVENIKKVDQERKNIEKGNKAPKDASFISSDGKRLNETASDVHTVKSTADLHPEIRSEKVQEVKDKIKSGYYNSEEFIDKLADKIMKDFGI